MSGAAVSSYIPGSEANSVSNTTPVRFLQLDQPVYWSSEFCTSPTASDLSVS